MRNTVGRGVGNGAIWFVLAVVAILSGTACGTRVGRIAEGEASNRDRSGDGTAVVTTERVEDQQQAVAKGPDLANGRSAVHPPAGPAPNRVAGAPPATSAASSPSGRPSGSALSREQRVPTVPGQGVTTTTTGVGTARPVGSSVRSPAVFASVGTYNGPLGSVLKPMVQGAQVWVKDINQNGGLNGHDVKLLVYDDGGDPSRHRAQVQQAVERDRAIAFLMNGEALTGAGSVSYIDAKRIPVVGGDAGEPWAESSAMYFPQATNGPAQARAFAPSIAAQVVPEGKTKLGTLICVEAPICDQADRAMADNAKASGFQHVYRGRASFGQPDYTAECLSARNSGADVLYMTLDASAVERVATACTRQGYRPVFAIPAQAVQLSMEDDPNLAGTVSSSPVFPYFQSNTPATKEYQDAIRALVGHNIGAAPMGWVAGKLMEKAGADLPEPPTSESILAGLWTVKSDTLGGLTAPLTFVRDKPASSPSCWFGLRIKDGSWVSPDGFKLSCL